MLRRLVIQNYALIEALDVSFPEHLIIITGETGAGKTILLGALSLLLGAKSDARVLSDKERNCIVEGEFTLNGEEYVIRRVVTPQGRSRSFVNDEPVNADELRTLASSLIDIHAQNQQLMLADSGFQLSVLDSFGGNAPRCAEFASLLSDWRKAQGELKAADAAIAKAKLERDFNQEQFDVLDAAKLKEGEQSILEEEQKKLANAEEIQADMKSVLDKFSREDEDYSLVQDLKDAEQTCRKDAAWIPALAGIADRMESCRLDLKDMEQEMDAMSEEISVSPDRLQEVDERLSALYTLERRYGASNEEELIGVRERYSAALSGAADMESGRAKLAGRCIELEGECEKLAAELHKSRVQASEPLSKELETSIRELNMPYAVFRVDVNAKKDFDENGKDEVKFMFSANGKSSVEELALCASGGELSRIMLCIKALLARYRNMPTMIFDEIDTGVSGSIADRMGDVIVRMGKSMQVIAITHLPQMAAKGDAHFVVTKDYDKDREKAATYIRRVEGEERVTEIAKMLSGAELSKAALDNARVLLGVEKGN